MGATMTDGFALFKDDVQISKAHSTRMAAIIEAFERKVIVLCGHSLVLGNGYAVRPVHG